MSRTFVTGRCRASYLQVFTMRAVDEGEKEAYSVALLIPKSDTVTLDKVRAAQREVLAEKFKGKTPAKFDDGLRDGDAPEHEKKGEAYRDHYFLNAKNYNRAPGVVDLNLDPILDASQFVSGDYCRASVQAFGYDTKGNKGCAWGLNNIQMLAKGEPLGNVTRPEDDFGEPIADTAAAAAADDNDDFLK